MGPTDRLGKSGVGLLLIVGLTEAAKHAGDLEAAVIDSRCCEWGVREGGGLGSGLQIEGLCGVNVNSCLCSDQLTTYVFAVPEPDPHLQATENWFQMA